MGEFIPFPEPRNPQTDKALVEPAGANYKCNGCGEIGDWHGMQIHSDVDDKGMVTGIYVTLDISAKDVPPVHACGTRAVSD